MKKSSLEIERLLLPRLRFIGMLLLFFSVFSVFYSILSSPYLSTVGLDREELVVEEESLVPTTDELPFSLSPFERISLYFVAAVFGTVGSACLYVFWRKKAELEEEIDTPSREEGKQ